MASYVAPGIKDKFETLSTDLKNLILERNVELNNMQDLIRGVENLLGLKEKQQAAQAFVNYISRPDNVVRNMYYVGYTSVISGGEDKTIYDYIKYMYGSEDKEKALIMI